MLVRRLTLVVLPCCAVLAAGCGTKTIKEGDLETKISQSLEDQLTGRKVAVDCPSGKEAKKGNTFTCTATVDGRTSTVQVQAQDETGRVRLLQVRREETAAP